MPYFSSLSITSFVVVEFGPSSNVSAMYLTSSLISVSSVVGPAIPEVSGAASSPEPLSVVPAAMSAVTSDITSLTLSVTLPLPEGAPAHAVSMDTAVSAARTPLIIIVFFTWRLTLQRC